MTALPEIQQSLDLLAKIRQALETKDFTVLLTMAEAYSHSIRHLAGLDNAAVIKQLLAAHEAVETSLYQVQREVNAQLEQVTQDKINHAYQAV